MNRRKFLQQIALAGGGVLANEIARADQTPGLQDLVRRCGKLVGIEANYGDLSDPGIAAIVAREGGILTPGNEMKWTKLHPAPGKYDFYGADWMVNWALAHHIKVHGHNLIWQDYGAPQWVLSQVNSSNARGIIEDHIATVVGRYAGKIQSWDVVNEVFMPQDGRSDLMGRHPWVDALGADYIAIAFEAAARADPKAVLVWNEHHLEHDTDLYLSSRAAMVKTLRMFKQRGVPIHVLGLESHLRGDLPLATANLERFIGDVRSLGIKIYITELDVDDTHLPADISVRDGIVADYYKRYLDLMCRIADPEVIIFWSLTDRKNYLDWAAQSKPQLYGRSDAQQHRPGLLDSSLNRKPAYTAVAQSLANWCK